MPASRSCPGLLAGLAVLLALGADARADVTHEEVEQSIRLGVGYLTRAQQPNGSWGDLAGQHAGGTTSLATLALLTAGLSPREPHVAQALAFLHDLGPGQMNSTYAVALQTMVFAAADPAGDLPRIERNAEWLVLGQARFGDRGRVPGIWSYSSLQHGGGDNSNTQYALLGLNAAREAGVKVPPEVWELSRRYWTQIQRPDGSWGYQPRGGPSSGSMTCAGISSLVIAGSRQFEQREILTGDEIVGCGAAAADPSIRRAFDWLAARFTVAENINTGQQWKYYYLYGLERAGRLTGQRYIGGHDWYREGAEELVGRQDRISGNWPGGVPDTCFSLLFLAKGRAPVLVNKLRHGPLGDWNNDLDDARNLVDRIARDWNQLLTWQAVDPNLCTVEDLLQAPIAMFNGHQAPVFSAEAKQRLREFVEQGGFILADACCGKSAFDEGFRALVKEIFPEPELALRPLAEEHPLWRARHRLDPSHYRLFGIDHGCRTVLVYSPDDLSCYWNQCEAAPNHPRVLKAVRLGENIVDYATGREPPPDKLVVREVHRFGAEGARRGALQIAKLRHGGDWNIAPLAVPNLTSSLRERLGFDVVVNHRELLPTDPNLRNFPLIYLHGRSALVFGDDDLARLRSHLEPGGGTIFADAACGSATFDESFRKFVRELLPNSALVPIPPDDEIYTERIGYDLSKSRYSKAAGGATRLPQLEGVKLDGHWAIIYSSYDIGCALEHHEGIECKGYSHESALKIGANIVIYATLP